MQIFPGKREINWILPPRSKIMHWRINTTLMANSPLHCYWMRTEKSGKLGMAFPAKMRRNLPTISPQFVRRSNKTAGKNFLRQKNTNPATKNTIRQAHMKISPLKGLLFAATAATVLASCAHVKEYQKSRINDSEMI